MAVDPVGPCTDQSAPDTDPTERLTVAEDHAGRRLDHWLVEQLPGHSRSEIQRWIKEGHVNLDGAPTKPGAKIESGQIVVVNLPAQAPAEQLRPAAIPLDIVYEDQNLLVINKPAGMVVHPAPGHNDDTLVNAVLYHCPDLEGVGGAMRPGLVHRLDKETSGLIVVAKNDRSHRNLQAQWQARTVYKEYLALVDGTPDPPAGRISAPVGRHPTERKRQAVLPPDPVTGLSRGRDAVTEYYSEARYTTRLPGGIGTFTLVRVVLHTGRTHQIRVHFAWRRHPIIGDTLYGYKRQRLALDRHFLHAHKLRFRLPTEATGVPGESAGKTGGREMEFTAPLPPDLVALLHQLEENQL